MSSALERLPAELLDIVLANGICDRHDHCGDRVCRRDSYALCLASRHLRKFATPYLYRYFIHGNETSHHGQQVRRFVVTLCRNPVLARHVQELQLRPFFAFFLPYSGPDERSLLQQTLRSFYEAGSAPCESLVEGLGTNYGTAELMLLFLLTTRKRILRLALYEYVEDRTRCMDDYDTSSARLDGPDLPTALPDLSASRAFVTSCAYLQDVLLDARQCEKPHGQPPTLLSAFMQLPSLATMRCAGFGTASTNEVSYTPLPACNFSYGISRLELVSSDLQQGELLSLLECCAGLETLSTHLTPLLGHRNLCHHQFGHVAVDSPVLLAALQEHKTTLQRLTLQNTLIPLVVGRWRLAFATLVDFAALQELDIDISLLAEFQQDPYLMPLKLPPMLLKLTINGCEQHDLGHMLAACAAYGSAAFSSLRLVYRYEGTSLGRAGLEGTLIDQQMPSGHLYLENYQSIHCSRRQARLECRGRSGTLPPLLAEVSHVILSDGIDQFLEKYSQKVQCDKTVEAGEEPGLDRFSGRIPSCADTAWRTH